MTGSDGRPWMPTLHPVLEQELFLATDSMHGRAQHQVMESQDHDFVQGQDTEEAILLQEGWIIEDARRAEDRERDDRRMKEDRVRQKEQLQEEREMNERTMQMRFRWAEQDNEVRSVRAHEDTERNDERLREDTQLAADRESEEYRHINVLPTNDK